MPARNPVTAAQLRNLAARTHRGPLTPNEAARLTAGIERLTARPRRNSAVRWAKRAAALRRKLAALHHPVQRGSIAACAECSGWNGRRCTGLVTPWPCPTLELLDDHLPGKDSA
ncbi:hypothetical protein [Streptomyces huasconensis]|uniref:hypothetical protein n=1 Tax=Streptomyces huasconensis TaxID=1854574 RepID=UPI0037033B73